MLRKTRTKLPSYRQISSGLKHFCPSPFQFNECLKQMTALNSSERKLNIIRSLLHNS
jgi:hypothetical protein